MAQFLKQASLSLQVTLFNSPYVDNYSNALALSLVLCSIAQLTPKSASYVCLGLGLEVSQQSIYRRKAAITIPQGNHSFFILDGKISLKPPTLSSEDMVAMHLRFDVEYFSENAKTKVKLIVYSDGRCIGDFIFANGPQQNSKYFTYENGVDRMGDLLEREISLTRAANNIFGFHREDSVRDFMTRIFPELDMAAVDIGGKRQWSVEKKWGLFFRLVRAKQIKQHSSECLVVLHQGSVKIAWKVNGKLLIGHAQVPKHVNVDLLREKLNKMKTIHSVDKSTFILSEFQVCITAEEKDKYRSSRHFNFGKLLLELTEDTDTKSAMSALLLGLNSCPIFWPASISSINTSKPTYRKQRELNDSLRAA